MTIDQQLELLVTITSAVAPMGNTVYTMGISYGDAEPQMSQFATRLAAVTHLRDTVTTALDLDARLNAARAKG